MKNSKHLFVVTFMKRAAFCVQYVSHNYLLYTLLNSSGVRACFGYSVTSRYQSVNMPCISPV